MVLSEKPVLVTGASGFVGGRLTEKLILEHGVRVRALVHDFRSSTWLARTSAEMASGDLTDIESLRHAVGGVPVVFHCAVKSTLPTMRRTG